MKRHLNTLFVMTQGSHLAKDGLSVVVCVDREVKLRLPVHTIGGIVCFGRVSCTSRLMGFCAENGVGISFLTETGRFLARVQGPVSGNVLLRREQYRRADDLAFSGDLAGTFITGKIANCRIVLQRALRDHPESTAPEQIEAAVHNLGRILARLGPGIPLDELRGIEGDAARIYLECFDHLISAQKDGFFFRGRSRRPPLDNVNALLSFVYTLLMHDIRSALEAVGLDPAVGYLHRDRPGRPGLALDMMEEFRPVLADRLVLSLINRKQVAARGFVTRESGGVLMDDPTRKQVIMAWQERKKDEMEHPFLDERVTVGLLPHIQALLFARFLRGDLDGYPPFLWR